MQSGPTIVKTVQGGKEVLRWEGFVTEVGVEPGVKE